VLEIDRSLYVYKSKRGEQAELKLRIRDICQTRVRYGYRRVHVLLKRDGWSVNPKRIYLQGDEPAARPQDVALSIA
jgi:putative transposase